jgi:8-oxo-dGTP pyrophosphatase MutT (NUDIX family)/DNA-binding transcriptional regulator YhcF (GntR family)
MAVPDPRDPRPVYEQIAADLRAAIEQGRLQPGDRLPTEREHAARYGVAIGTYRQAIAVLRDEGLLATYKRHGTVVLIPPEKPRSPEYTELSARLGRVEEAVAELAQIIRAREPGQDGQPEPSLLPEPAPIVAAIVTSHLGVLIARRNDGKPPWTFIAGEIEPGESPTDAAVREVKEETGLRIQPGRVIGRRVHPQTGRTMVYMAARPTHGTDAFVGDEQELAEVRWATLTEADELMGGMIFEPVRIHLKKALGGGSADQPDTAD